MSRLRLCLALAPFLALAGCAAFQEGETVVKYKKGDPPLTTEAPMDATYALYSFSDLEPKVAYVLKKGDKIGFEKSSDTGLVKAVAGSNELPLPLTGDDNFYWRRQ